MDINRICSKCKEPMEFLSFGAIKMIFEDSGKLHKGGYNYGCRRCNIIITSSKQLSLDNLKLKLSTKELKAMKLRINNY